MNYMKEKQITCNWLEIYMTNLYCFQKNIKYVLFLNI